MVRQAMTNPFTPNFGIEPPFMAGRDEEKALLAASLETLQGAVGAAEHAVLVGPRGCGKTSLMIWLRRHIQDTHPNVRVQKLTTTLPSTQGAIAAHILKDAYRSKLPEKVGVRLEAGLASADASWSIRGLEAELIVALKKACAKNPLVLLVDETQSCSSQGLHHLFNLVQDVNSDTRNLFAVLAGTPAITEVLHGISATFYNRTEKICIGLIDELNASHALRRPLEDAGYSIEAAALKQLIDTCQGFPYFLQKSGKLILDAAQTDGAVNVTSAHFDAIADALRGTQIDSYSEREADWQYEDIPILASVVQRVAALVQEGRLRRDDLILATERALDESGMGSIDRAIRIAQRMHDTGLFWQPPKQEYLSVGLPSFASYIVDRARARATSTMLQ